MHVSLTILHLAYHSLETAYRMNSLQSGTLYGRILTFICNDYTLECFAGCSIHVFPKFITHQIVTIVRRPLAPKPLTQVTTA